MTTLWTKQPECGPFGFPRRCDELLDTPLEAQIRAAMKAVEQGPAHPLLTDAVRLLNEAKDKVSDYLETIPVSVPGAAAV